MLNTLYNYEADSLFELVPALDGQFSYNDIKQFDIDKYYKNFVTAELKWRLLDSFIPFIQCNNIYLEDDFEKTLNNFFNYSARYAYFSGEELREIFKTAVKYKISSIFQPVELLNLHFFTNNYTITKAELFIKKDYFFGESIANDIAQSFFDKYKSKDNLDLINRSGFRKFINNYGASLIENTSKTTEHLDFIRKYLADFSLEFNILNISLLFDDLNINYVADKLRTNFKDDYVPNNDMIINFLESGSAQNGDINQSLDEIINMSDSKIAPQSYKEEERLEINKKSIFASNDELDILDNILDDVDQMTSNYSAGIIDKNIDLELDLIEENIVDESINQQEESIETQFDKIENDNFAQNKIESNESKKTQNDMDLDEAINSELKSIMDIINL